MWVSEFELTHVRVRVELKLAYCPGGSEGEERGMTVERRREGYQWRGGERDGSGKEERGTAALGEEEGGWQWRGGGAGRICASAIDDRGAPNNTDLVERQAINIGEARCAADLHLDHVDDKLDARRAAAVVRVRFAERTIQQHASEVELGAGVVREARCRFAELSKPRRDALAAWQHERALCAEAVVLLLALLELRLEPLKTLVDGLRGRRDDRRRRQVLVPTRPR